MFLLVDIATGHVTRKSVDLRLPGYIPFELVRTYDSGRSSPGRFGYGWDWNLDVALHRTPEGYVLRTGSGRTIRFPSVARGGEVRCPVSGMTLHHEERAFVVDRPPRLRWVFPKHLSVRDVVRLDHIRDPLGHTLHFAYGGGRLLHVADSVGRRIQFNYRGDVVAEVRVTDPAGASAPVKSFRYDRAGDLVAVVDAARNESRYQYEDHLVTVYASRLNGTEFAQYDERRRCIALWHHAGSEGYHLAYDDEQGVTRVVAVNGRQRFYRHGDQGLVVKQEDPFGGTRQYAYDEARCVVGVMSDERAGGFMYREGTDDEAPFLAGQGERIVRIFTGAAGLQPVHVDDVMGHRYTLTYDEHRALVGLTTPAETVWRFTRGPDGTVTDVVSPEGRRVQLWRSGPGERTVRDELGIRYRARYNVFGQLTEYEDAIGRRERRRYDALQRLVEVTVGGYYVLFTYDAAGNVISYADADGRTARLTCDASGVMQAYTVAPGGGYSFAYAADGSFTAATDPQGRDACFSYDARGRLARLTFFDGRTETCHYGGPGVTVRVREAEGEAVRVYNAHMDLIREKYPDGTRRDVDLGPRGEVYTVETEQGTYVLDVDPEGRLRTLRWGVEVLTFDRDRDGLLLAVTDGAGRRVGLRYDRRCRVETVHVGDASAHRCRYDASDRLSALETAAGTRLVFRYDDVDRLVERVLETDGGSSRDGHRFGKDVPGPQVDVMGRHVGPAEPEDTAAEQPVRLELWQGRYGVLLVARFGTRPVPVWEQRARISDDRPSEIVRLLQAMLHGPEAALPGPRVLDLIGLQRPWFRPADQGVDVRFTDIPSASDTLPAWATLDLWVLRMPVQDPCQVSPGVPWFRRLGGGCAGVQDGAFLVPATRTSFPYASQPLVLEPRLDRRFLRRKRGDLSPRDMLFLLID